MQPQDDDHLLNHMHLQPDAASEHTELSVSATAALASLQIQSDDHASMAPDGIVSDGVRSQDPGCTFSDACSHAGPAFAGHPQHTAEQPVSGVDADSAQLLQTLFSCPITQVSCCKYS